MNQEKYLDSEEFREGYEDACIDLLNGDLTEDSAFELVKEDITIVKKDEDEDFKNLFSDIDDDEDEDEDEDCCEDCDEDLDCPYHKGFIKGYAKGYEDAAEEYYEDEEVDRVKKFEDSYPEEIVLDAAPFNTIESIKDEIRVMVSKLYNEVERNVLIDDLFDLLGHLDNLETLLAGKAVLDFYVLD